MIQTICPPRRQVVSEFRFVCFCGLHKNDPRNHTKSHEQSCFVWLRGSFSISSQSLKIRKLRHYPTALSQLILCYLCNLWDRITSRETFCLCNHRRAERRSRDWKSR